MEQKKIDMTTGPIMKKVFLFAIPMVAGNILQYLYTTVDILVIENYCGETSLAAVGTSFQPVEVLLCVFLGIGTGVFILISQYAGVKDEAKHIVMIGLPIGLNNSLYSLGHMAIQTSSGVY